MENKPATIDENLVAELMSSDNEIEHIIPEDPTLFMASLRRLMSTGDALMKGTKRWQVILGQYAAAAKRNPGLWKATYKDFGDFFHNEIVVPMGREPSTAYTWKRMAEAYPDKSVDEIKSIPTANANVAGAIAKGKNEKEREEILEKARTLPTAEFKAWAESGKHAGPGDLTRREIKFDGTEAQIYEINKLLADPEFAEWAGTNNRTDMMLMSLRASTAEFGGMIPHAKLVKAVYQFHEDGNREHLIRRILSAVEGEQEDDRGLEAPDQEG